jgi:predicted glycoside hydrolase/deacetylase ChbG (UPF0249 family)
MSAAEHQDATVADPASRRIWLCADDYGISPSVNTAIRELIMRGRLNATSVMVVAPSFRRAEAISLGILNSGHQRVAIGLHVTLTAPFVPLSHGFRPLRDGAFLPLEHTLRGAFLRRFSRQRLGVEIATQLKAFVTAFGRPPDFIDGHQHVHLLPQVRDAVLTVASEAAPHAWVRQCGRVTPLRHRLTDRKGHALDIMSRTFRRRARRLGIHTNPAFAGTYAYEDKADYAELFPRFLHRLPPDSVVMCHPGFVDDELKRLDPLTLLREREYEFFIGNEFPRLLTEHGITLQTTEQRSGA